MPSYGGISNDRAVEWLRGVYLLLILREDLDPAEEKELIADFVLPSLVASN